MNSRTKWILASLFVFSIGLPVFAQDPNPASPAPSGGWRRFEPSDAAPPADAAQPPARRQSPPPEYRDQAPPPSAPRQLTVPAGTWISIRVSEPLSSDHNQPGDMFAATLAQPIVADGRIIARRGQTVTGVVSEAKKAGRVEGTSRLGLELTEIGLANGRQVQVKTRLMERRGDTSYGRDATAIGATVGTGAAIGAAVNGGVGAGVGAAAGVVASTIGVMLTRGKATVVYPEQPLTFRLESAITVDGYDEAFQYAAQQDYDTRTVRRAPPRYAYPPPPPYGPYYYGGWFSPYYGYGFGPNFYFSYRRGFRRW